MNDKIIAHAAEFISTTRDCVLALIDFDGYPTAATVTPSKTVGIHTIYIGNGIGGNWAKRAASCGRASFCYGLSRPEYNVTLVGDMEVVTDDLALKTEMWRDWMPMYWSGPEDHNFCVLRFKTQRYSIYMDGTQIRGTI